MKKFFHIVLLLSLAISFVAFKPSVSNPPENYEVILKLVGQLISQAHYSPKKIDNDFSKKVFKKYINSLDGEKNIFLKADIENLNGKYGNQIDDELNGAKAQSFIAVSNIFNERIKQSEFWSKEILSKPFDYTIKEEVQLNGKLLNFPASDQDRKERWRKKLKYLALEKYVEMLNEKAANKGKKEYVLKSNEKLEEEARAKTNTMISSVFSRYKTKFTEEESFNLFVNAITSSMDPHTTFFPPVDNRYFEEELSGKFFGIGAMLQSIDGKIKITSINAGSPAAKSKALAPGDIINAVAQGDEPAVDLMGFSVQEVVKLIRGKEGTFVTLTVAKPDGTIRTVKLKREQIENVETFARSAVINDKANKRKIGVIYLPEFYTSFGDSTGRRSYTDVAIEVEKLTAEKVDGIIMDLRYNIGGSLYDVVEMVGLFIDKGPVVQIQDRNNTPQVLSDTSAGVKYSGPLAVMVNEFSASASEIFAAAIQDYSRGIVIGSTSTYGKGTVQQALGLDEKTIFTYNQSDLGALKLTLQKFYRVSGGSTQLKGVESDIILPGQTGALKLRERDSEDALSYDEIKPVSYKPWIPSYDFKTVKKSGAERVYKDNVFKTIKQNTELLAARNDKSFYLNIDELRGVKQLMKLESARIDSVQKLKNKMSVSLPQSDANKYKNDKEKLERSNLWLKGLSEDIYLNQAVKTVTDMIRLGSAAKPKKL